MCKKRLFLAVLLLTEGILACPAGAVPSVKKLGGTATNNIQGSINKGSLTKLSTASQRTPSVRALGLSEKPATNTTNNTMNISAKTATSTDSMRLSGLHGNLIKGIASKISSNSSQQQGGGGNITSELEQRITNLEAEITTKQNILESGDGIIIDGTTISLSDEIASLPEEINTITQDIDDLNEKIDAVSLSEEYYTKEQVNQMISQLSDMNIVDTFVPEEFLKQLNTPKGQP